MPEIIEPYYVSMLKSRGFTPDPDDHQYGALGLCWKLSPEIGEGSYWTYGQKDLYDIKIHNFSFHEDSLLEFSLPECLSITRYDSISGEELAPYGVSSQANPNIMPWSPAPPTSTPNAISGLCLVMLISILQEMCIRDSYSTNLI